MPEKPRYLQQWSEMQISRMLSNPFYCGVRVDPHLVVGRPNEYNRGLFMNIAIANVKDLGPENSLRVFLSDLKIASSWTRCIPVHSSFLIDRIGIVTEEQFIKAGAQQINNTAKSLQQTSATPWEDAVCGYFALVIENLEFGNLSLS